MPLPPPGIDPMPSPPPAPDLPIDVAHLRRMTFGDAGLKREVLGMFAEQAMGLFGRLSAQPTEAPALAHTLKGSARAIGAFRVADRAGALEAAMQKGDDPSQALAELGRAVAEVRASIAAILDRL